LTRLRKIISSPEARTGTANVPPPKLTVVSPS
jgi:hypothetical protein